MGKQISSQCDEAHQLQLLQMGTINSALTISRSMFARLSRSSRTNKSVLNPTQQQHLSPELLHLSKQQRF